MGLDITAYQRSVHLPEHTCPSVDYDYRHGREDYAAGIWSVFGFIDFAHALDGMETRADANGILRAGAWQVVDREISVGCSYGFWSHFRDQIARTHLGLSEYAEVVGMPADTPFRDLLWHSDCDGWFGPTSARRIASAMYAHDVAALEGEGERDLYRRVRACFALAADEGLVRFA